jgi:hypothetical protein
MNPRRILNTLLLASFISLTGCKNDYVILPNGTRVEGKTFKSSKFPNNLNLKSNDYSDETLETRSKFEGVIKKISSAKDKTKKIDKLCFFLNHSSNENYELQIKPVNISLSYRVAIINYDDFNKSIQHTLTCLKVGDTVIIPSIRRYDEPSDLFKILNDIDNYKPNEFNKKESQLDMKSDVNKSNYIYRNILYDGGEIKIPISLDKYFEYKKKPALCDIKILSRQRATTLNESTLDQILRSMNLSTNNELKANTILSFVHGFVYIKDDIIDSYNKTPIETIVEGGGDCEDFAVLAYTLMYKAGLDVVYLDFPGHAALGVRGNFNGKYVIYNDKKYHLAEATGTEWNNHHSNSKIGEFSDYASAEVFTHENNNKINAKIEDGNSQRSVALNIIPEKTITNTGNIGENISKEEYEKLLKEENEKKNTWIINKYGHLGEKQNKIYYPMEFINNFNKKLESYQGIQKIHVKLTNADEKGGFNICFSVCGTIEDNIEYSLFWKKFNASVLSVYLKGDELDSLILKTNNLTTKYTTHAFDAIDVNFKYLNPSDADYKKYKKILDSNVNKIFSEIRSNNNDIYDMMFKTSIIRN